jgi:phosphoribosylamine-glycine ligase
MFFCNIIFQKIFITFLNNKIMNFNVRSHDPQFQLVIKVRAWLGHDKGYKQTCFQGMT